MCGATDAQNQLQSEDMQTMQDYDAAFQQQYANQGAIYSKVKSVLDPILSKGPNQEGFSDAEKNNLDAQAVAGTASNYSAAAKAVGEGIAAEGGGNAPISSGAADQLKEETAQSAAKNESDQETQITAADYTAGREEFQNAEQGEMSIASEENPLGYASATTSQGEATGTVANQIAQEDNSWYTAALGAAGGIAGHVIDQNPANIFG